MSKIVLRSRNSYIQVWAPYIYEIGVCRRLSDFRQYQSLHHTMLSSYTEIQEYFADSKGM